MWSCKASHAPFQIVFLTYSTYLEPQKLVIFGLQLCPINHKNCRSWNLKTHIFGGKVWHHILKQINHFQWRHEVCPLNQFSCTKFNHLRQPNFHVTLMKMKFSILARSWKFKKTGSNSFLQTPSQSLTGKQKNPSLSTSRHINNITA